MVIADVMCILVLRDQYKNVRLTTCKNQYTFLCNRKCSVRYSMVPVVINLLTFDWNHNF